MPAKKKLKKKDKQTKNIPLNLAQIKKKQIPFCLQVMQI